MAEVESSSSAWEPPPPSLFPSGRTGRSLRRTCSRWEIHSPSKVYVSRHCCFFFLEGLDNKVLQKCNIEKNIPKLIAFFEHIRGLFIITLNNI